jgi:predicted nucleotidyltransferase
MVTNTRPVASSSGALLREARRRAGLSQAELAARTGVAQSVISVYESGRRQPALPTLAALIKATGFDLDVRLRQRRLDRLSGPLGSRLRRQRREVLRAARASGVRIHGVFGSVARGEDRPDSDIDLLVDLPPGMGLFGVARLQGELQQILDAPVELIPAADLKPGVRPTAVADLVPL